MATKELTAYEKRRLDNIKRNEELLAQLGIDKVKADIAVEDDDSNSSITGKKRKLDPLENGRRRKEARTGTVTNPGRVSQRLLGLPPAHPEGIQEEDEIEAEKLVRKVNGKSAPKKRKSKAHKPDFQTLIAPLEYWEKKKSKPKIIVNGHFKGWVNPDYIKKYNVPATEVEVNTKEDDKKKKKGSTVRVSAKDRAAGLLHKNPNAYFYRHNAPGVEQWTGEWSAEEYELFVSIVEKYGAGDRWGLFSSYIPHRVGYQCANFYRYYVLPKGEVVDPNYYFTPDGEVVYVPPKGKTGNSIVRVIEEEGSNDGSE